MNDSAIKAVHSGMAPGVVRVGGGDEAVEGLGIAGVALGFLAWVTGVYPGGKNWPNAKPATSVVPPVMENQTAPEPGKEGEPAADSSRPADESSDQALDQSLPANPDDLLLQGYKEISHPKAVVNGRRTFTNPQTGDTVVFDKGVPGATGYKERDHYHRENPDRENKINTYLDKNRFPVKRESKPSHIFLGGKNE